MKKIKAPDRYRILVVIRWPIGGLRTFLCYVHKHFNPSLYCYTILLPEQSEQKSLEEGLNYLNPTYIKLPSHPSHIVFIKELLKIIRSEKFDLIYSHGFTAGIYSALPARLWRTPHILTLHELLYKEDFIGIKGILKLKMLSVLLSNLNVIHLVSENAKYNLLQFLPHLKNKRTKLIPILSGIEISKYRNGVVKRDLHNELNLQKDTFLIGFLGRFMPVKGFKYLVDALEYLLEHADEIEKKPIIVTFGWGAYIREEMEAVRKKKLDKHVFSLPFTPDVASALKGLDVAVMPSLCEACGLLAMEVMVTGIPLIGTDCSGLREVLKYTPAVMVPAGDGVTLGKALIREIKTPSQSEAQAFRDKAARRFDVKKQAMELEKVIQELLHDQAPE